MKRRLVFLLMVLLASSEISAQKGLDKFEVQVDGLGCPFCAYGLEKKFREFEGIKQIKIDKETGNFTFVYPAEKKLSLDAVQLKVQKAGYIPVAANVTRADGQIEALHKTLRSDKAAGNLKQASAGEAGNCEMCRAGIDKATLGQIAVQKASRDITTKLLKVEFEEKATSIIGHATEHLCAYNEAYKNLPGCCQYGRILPEYNLK